MNLRRFPVFILIPLLGLLVACMPKSDGGGVQEHPAVDKFENFQKMGYLQGFTIVDLNIESPNPVMDLLVKDGTLVMYEWDSTLAPHRQIELQLQGVLPLLSDLDLQIDTIKMRIDEEDLSEPGDEEPFIFTDTIVETSIRVLGGTYREDIFYTKIYANPSPYLLINRFLADIKYPKRLFAVDWRCNDCSFSSWSTLEGMGHDMRRTGAILLNEKAAKAIYYDDLLPISWGEFGMLTTTEVEQYSTMMEDLGLFDQEDPDVIARRKVEVTRQRFYGSDELFFVFTSPTFTFDVHNIENKDPYGYLIQELSEAMPIEFAPEKVVAQYGDTETDLSFSWKGQSYSTNLEEDDGWLDVQFLKLVNDALRDQEVNGQLWAIDEWGQEVDLLYLEDEVYEKVKKNALLDLIQPEESNAVQEGRYFENELEDEYQ